MTYGKQIMSIVTITLTYLLGQLVTDVGATWATIIYYIYAYAHMDTSEQETTIGKVFFASIIIHSVYACKSLGAFLHLVVRYGTIIDKKLWTRNNVTCWRWPARFFQVAAVAHCVAASWLMIKSIPFNDDIKSYHADIAIKIIAVIHLITICLWALILISLLVCHIIRIRRSPDYVPDAPETLTRSRDSVLSMLESMTRSYINNIIPMYPDTTCPICQDELVTETAETAETAEPIVNTPCGHRFHRECLVPWLQKSNTCPMCRTDLPEVGMAVVEDV